MRRVLIPLLATLLVLGTSPARAGDPAGPVGGEIQLGKAAGLKYVAEQLTSDGNFENLSVACGPDNSPWHPTGGGVRMSDDPGANSIKALRPLDLAAPLESPDDQALDDYWESSVGVAVGTQVTAWGVCTKRSTSYVLHDTPDAKTNERTDTATCPTGKHLVGGGSFIATTGSYVSSSYPSSGQTWTTRIYDTVGGLGGMQVYASCRTLGNVKIVKHSATVAAGETATATAVCPASRHVVGGGGRITGDIGEGRIVASLPRDSLDRGDVPDDQWRASAYNSGTQPRTLTAYALCVRRG